MNDLLKVIEFWKRDSDGNLIFLSSFDSAPYGIAWDGSVFWIGNYQGTFFGYTINESNGFYLEQVGSFDAPVSNFTSITYDGSSFLVSALDGSNTIYRIGYDGEILNEYAAGTWELNSAIQGLHFDPLANQLLVNSEFQFATVEILENEGLFNTVEIMEAGTSGYLYDNISTDDSYVYVTDWDRYQVIYDRFYDIFQALDLEEGIVYPGEMQSVTTKILSGNYLPGTYNYTFAISSNDPSNSVLSVPLTFTIEPGEMLITPESVSLELYVNEQGEEDIVSLSNNGGYPIEWTAELQMDGDDVRDLSNQLDPQVFRSQWQDQMIPRQIMTPEMEAEIQKKLDKYGRDSFQAPVTTESPESALLSGDFILPPEAHRSRNGNTMITMLMDNSDHPWNTMDALSNYYTDYELNEVYTNWDPYTLENEIQGSDLVLIPYGHWVDNYDSDFLSQVLLDYVETGGGVLFTGYNFNEYGDLISNSGPYNDWCCGDYYESNSEYYDEDHPIMEGVTDGGIDIYSFATTSLSSDNDIEVVFNISL